MRIALEHLERLVARDRGHLHDVESRRGLEKATCGLMPEIVKGEIDQEGRIRLFLLLLAFLLVVRPQ